MQPVEQRGIDALGLLLSSGGKGSVSTAAQGPEPTCPGPVLTAARSELLPRRAWALHHLHHKTHTTEKLWFLFLMILPKY